MLFKALHDNKIETWQQVKQSKRQNTPIHLPHSPNLSSLSFCRSDFNYSWRVQRPRQAGRINPRNKEDSYKKKVKTVINKMKGTERPCHSSVYFHRTSTLVCVMTTLSREEQGNFRLAACPVSGETCWSGNGVQEPVDTPPPPPAAAPRLPLVD